MKTMKKLAAMVVAMAMVIAMVPATAFAEEAEEMSWEERLMSCFGISAGNNYFAAGQAPNESTIYTYINMNLEEYLDDEWYYTLTYEEYMSVVDKYFVNYVEMKEYLTQLGQYDAETNIVRICSGGFGGGASWELTSTYEAADGTYVLQGLCLDEPSTTAGNVYESYEWEGTTYYVNILNPVELTVSSNVDGEWEIISFEKGLYYIYEDEKCGTTLVMNDEMFYPVNIKENDLVDFIFTGWHKFKNNDNYWYSPNNDFNWTAVPAEGYTCLVMVEQLVDGEISGGYAGTGGVIYGSGEVTLTPVPCALFMMEAENATVVIKQGLTDMGDGTYAYQQGACVELTVEAKAGYRVDSVMVGDYDAKLNSFGTYTAYPTFAPGKIVVETSAENVFVNEDNSAAEVTVIVPVEEVEEFEGLSLVVEELDEEVETKAVALIIENADSNVEEVYILDIYFENQDGEEVSVDATMTVTVPIPEGWDPARVAVYYVNPETGEVTDMNGTVSADGKTISFVTTHFSNYALVQTAEETTEGGAGETIPEEGKTPENENKAPATGDSNSVILWMGMMAAAGYVVVSMKRKEEM